MDRLGALFMKAKKELLMQMAVHLKRLPTMPKLAFNEGTGFADPQTQMWIENEVAPVLGGEGDGGGGGGAPSVLDEPIKEARSLATKGELGKAIDLVSDAAASAPSPAERFRGRLAVAQLCIGAGQNAIARSQLEGLTEDIEMHSLAAWDPKLCAEVYAGLYSSIKTMNKARKPAPGPTGAPMMPGMPGAVPDVPPEEEAAEQHAFEMLCKLDPHRYVGLAMDRLGALFMKAKKELLMQMAVHLKRLPTMPKLAFNEVPVTTDSHAIASGSLHVEDCGVTRRRGTSGWLRKDQSRLRSA
jgi:hypothetical protein